MGTQTLKSVTALKGKKSLRTKLHESLEGYMFILPSMVIIGLFGLFPVFFTLVVSLHKWRIKQGRFLGVENFLEVFGAIAYLAVLILGIVGLYIGAEFVLLLQGVAKSEREAAVHEMFGRIGLEGLERVPLNGDHDVFGDGRVRILSLPGHTPGHQGLFVDLEHEGPVVLSGDLYHFRLSREERIVPTFNVDAEATLRSMDRLEAFLLEAGATLWIEHDLARYTDGIPAAGYHN